AIRGSGVAKVAGERLLDDYVTPALQRRDGKLFMGYGRATQVDHIDGLAQIVERRKGRNARLLREFLRTGHGPRRHPGHLHRNAVDTLQPAQMEARSEAGADESHPNRLCHLEKFPAGIGEVLTAAPSSAFPEKTS